MLDTALELIRHGFVVFPLAPKTKVPPKSFAWKELATKDVEVARRMFGPEGNVALVMGRASGIIGLDIDYDDGADPDFLKRLPPTWTVRTGKGHHVYYRYPSHWPEIGKATLLSSKGKDGRPKACVQLRGNGHYFVGPGSIHPETGAQYQWEKYDGWSDSISCDVLSPEEIPLADAPEFLLDAINSEAAVEKAPGQKYYENERHGMFVATATSMARAGKSYQEIVDRLLERNATDCVPPKQNAAGEIANIAKWATISVAKSTITATSAEPVASQERQLPSAIRALGHLDNDYFYLTDSNQQISKLTAAAHTSTQLLNLMPYEYWASSYFSKKGVDWTLAASDLMLACRKVGIFNVKKMRGEGAWREDGKLILHCGDRLVLQGEVKGLRELPSTNTYRLGPTVSYESGAGKATNDDCQLLLKACSSPKWVRPESALLLAGFLPLLRLSGALPWRPHAWLTGSAGSGKTTLMTTLVRTMVGDWGAYFQGVTTEAGIRQRLGCASLPVIFDEAESDNKRGAGRIQHILELARQASSESEARIVKGTPDGRGLSFKINSCFLLASIRVSLPQEADQTRFTVLELDRPSSSGDDSAQFHRALREVDAGVASRLFRLYLDRFDDLLKNYELCQRIIGEGSSPRHGQQYGMLVASLGILTEEGVLREAGARELIERCRVIEAKQEDDGLSDEMECIMHLAALRNRLHISDLDGPRDYSVRQLTELGRGNDTVIRKMHALGLSIVGQELAIASNHPELARMYSGTKWEGAWFRSLQRLPGARRGQVRLEKGYPQRATFVPISLVLSDEPLTTEKSPF